MFAHLVAISERKPKLKGNENVVFRITQLLVSALGSKLSWFLNFWISLCFTSEWKPKLREEQKEKFGFKYSCQWVYGPSAGSGVEMRRRERPNYSSVTQHLEEERWEKRQKEWKTGSERNKTVTGARWREMNSRKHERATERAKEEDRGALWRIALLVISLGKLLGANYIKWGHLFFFRAAKPAMFYSEECSVLHLPEPAR